MKNILLISFFLSFALSISAQTNFKQGYIITNDKDTIMGLIDFRTKLMNAQVCKFKEEGKDEIKTYHPGDIFGYRFSDEGKFYVSRNIELDGKTQTVFLEFLLQGIMNLYGLETGLYSTGVSQFYFLEDKNGKMYTIRKREDKSIYIENDDVNGKFIKEDLQYQGMLKYIFQESKNTLNKVDKIKYKEEDIIKITKDYHDNVCTSGEQCIIFETKEDKNYTNKRFSVYGGIQDYTLKLNETGGGVLSRLASIRSAFPIIGAQINLSVPRWKRSVSFQLDVAFSGINGEAISPNKGSNFYSTYTEYKYKTLLSTNKIGVKYTYWSKKVRPSIEGGLSSIFLFASSSTYSVRYNNKPDVVNISEDTYLPEGGFGGYYAAIGVDYMLPDNKSVFARIGYESHISLKYYPHTEFGPKISALSFKVGYGF